MLRAAAEDAGAASHLVPKVATGFGGGISRRGDICGALTGGIMALGVTFGRDKEGQGDADFTYEKSRQLIDEFKEKFGEFDCFKLTGCDFLAPGGYEEFQRKGIKEELCINLVRFAARRAAELMREKPPEREE